MWYPSSGLFVPLLNISSKRSSYRLVISPNSIESYRWSSDEYSIVNSSTGDCTSKSSNIPKYCNRSEGLKIISLGSLPSASNSLIILFFNSFQVELSIEATNPTILPSGGITKSTDFSCRYEWSAHAHPNAENAGAHSGIKIFWKSNPLEYPATWSGPPPPNEIKV